jgi:hypothetical protein
MKKLQQLDLFYYQAQGCSTAHGHHLDHHRHLSTFRRVDPCLLMIWKQIAYLHYSVCFPEHPVFYPDDYHNDHYRDYGNNNRHSHTRMDSRSRHIHPHRS